MDTLLSLELYLQSSQIDFALCKCKTYSLRGFNGNKQQHVQTDAWSTGVESVLLSPHSSNIQAIRPE